MDPIQKNKKPEEPGRGTPITAAGAPGADRAENQLKQEDLQGTAAGTGKQTPVTRISEGVKDLRLGERKKLSGAQRRKLAKLRKKGKDENTQEPAKAPGTSSSVPPSVDAPVGSQRREGGRRIAYRHQNAPFSRNQGQGCNKKRTGRRCLASARWLSRRGIRECGWMRNRWDLSSQRFWML